MLNITKQIENLYDDIQKKLYYMIPEKFDELYLYTSIYLDKNNRPTGELFFYYIPKGFIRRNPVSVYEVPQKFNLDEKQYLKLVDILYSRFQMLSIEYSKIIEGKMWTNLTLKIKSNKFKVIFDYEDLLNSRYNSYERHILWRYYVLGISLDKCTREEREIIKQYNSGVKTLGKKDEYESYIYIEKIKNIVDYSNPQEDKQYIGYITDDNKEEYEQNTLSQMNISKKINTKQILRDNTTLFKIHKKNKNDKAKKQENANGLNNQFVSYQNFSYTPQNDYYKQNKPKNQILK